MTKAGRPYYRAKEQTDAAIGLVAVSFVVGCMLGATLGLMWSTL